VSLLSSHSAPSVAGRNRLHHVCTWNIPPHKLVYSSDTKDLVTETDFWFPWSDCHLQVPKFHLENTTETTKFTENMKMEVNIDYLMFYLYAV
jgi:hypothetical protein